MFINILKGERNMRKIIIDQKELNPLTAELLAERNRLVKHPAYIASNKAKPWLTFGGVGLNINEFTLHHELVKEYNTACSLLGIKTPDLLSTTELGYTLPDYLCVAESLFYASYRPRTTDIITESELPELTGSAKQVAWANKIRLSILADNPHLLALKVMADSKFWIDTYK
jgi:hypothetical protein